MLANFDLNATFFLTFFTVYGRFDFFVSAFMFPIEDLRDEIIATSSEARRGEF